MDGMIAALLSVVLLGQPTPQPMPPLTEHGIPTSGVATFYGARCPKGVSYLGRTDTCTPYMTKERGGRGGELVLFAAVGSFSYYDKPYKVRVCLRDRSKCVIATVRDYCHGAWVSLRKPWTSASRVIDLSPTLFAALAPLSRGIVFVVVSEMEVRRGY